MTIITHPPVTVLYSTHQTTLKHLSQLIGVVVQDLIEEAVAHKALVSGPAYWIYKGADGKPDTLFTLEIAIPVQSWEGIDSPRFATKTLPPFKALTHTHEGSWEQFPKAYTQLMQYVDAQKLPLVEESRELYLNIDFQHPENNLTQIQIGVL